MQEIINYLNSQEPRLQAEYERLRHKIAQRHSLEHFEARNMYRDYINKLHIAQSNAEALHKYLSQ